MELSPGQWQLTDSKECDRRSAVWTHSPLLLPAPLVWAVRSWLSVRGLSLRKRTKRQRKKSARRAEKLRSSLLTFELLELSEDLSRANS